MVVEVELVVHQRGRAQLSTSFAWSSPTSTRHPPISSLFGSDVLPTRYTFFPFPSSINQSDLLAWISSSLGRLSWTHALLLLSSSLLRSFSSSSLRYPAVPEHVPKIQAQSQQLEESGFLHWEGEGSSWELEHRRAAG